MSTSGSGAAPRGISLSNTVHSEVAPCLPLPSLPVLCGADDPELRLVDERRSSRSLDRNDVLSQASKIADLLGNSDVSYLNHKAEASPRPRGFVDPPALCNEILRCNIGAFEFTSPGVEEQVYNTVSERKPLGQTVSFAGQPEKGSGESQIYQPDQVLANETSTFSSGKPKLKKKASNSNRSSTVPDPIELQESVIKGFCEFVEEFCGKAEIPSDDQDDSEWLQLPVTDVRMLVNEIVSIRGKKVLHLVPVEIFVSLLRVLDHQIHRAEGLSVNGCSNSDSDLVSSVCGALESIHAALAIMAHNGMPKQIYKEEIIERILEFCKHQIGDILSACDPAYRALHKPNEDEIVEDEEDDDLDTDFGSASKRRRTFRGVKVKKSSVNKISVAVNILLQKMCTILSLLKDLLTVERLSDSCILQLLKTSFTTLLVDNVELLQLKTIDLISGIFYAYMQHRTYVIDEVLQVLLKLPYAKRIPRTYHLHDEEQKQIQMVTALLIQLVHCSANLPDALRQASEGSSIFDVSIDPSYPAKCQEAITETCCLFWSRVLQRLTSTKPQDASELKAMIEHLVMDLLATLNLPEYPASASILEVLCVLLLQNAGLKSKDISVRSVATDLLGTIAARLKRDSVVSRKESFWIVQKLTRKDNDECNFPNDSCVVCMGGSVEKPLFLCQGCQKFFHANCMGVLEQEVPSRGWHCQFCHCRKQLLVLQTYSKSRCKDEAAENTSPSNKTSAVTGSISEMEIVQQMLLNYLQDGGSDDDVHLYTRWFLLCIWFKDDPESRKKFFYYLAKLKSKAIVRNSGIVSSSLTRVAVKKIALAIGLNNSFSRGFDKILHMLLVSLRENSPVIRAKALRAVSIIVEADPEVLFDEHVQSAVEGRFSDSAISVREAALELVGRYIASHPDVGSKYFEKVAERMKDTGVSVRKRAIKIIREMCTSIANFKEFTTACIEIISRASDDESSIQDLVCKTFYEFWFEENSGSQSQYFGDSSSVPLEVAKKTEQIVEMLRRMTSHQLLVTVIKRNLSLDFLPQSAKAAGINPVSLASVRKRCELMCKFLLERILQVEESNNGEAEVRTLPYVLLLNAFCVVDPTLCAPASDPSQFVITLQPYLKSQADNREVARLLESMIFIIDSVMPLLRKLPPNIVEELERDLKKMIVRHSFLTVVHACIKCICSLSKVAGKGSEIVEHLIQFFSKRLDALGLDNKQQIGQIGRSLFCLGLLIRYGNSLLSMPCSSNRNVDVKNSLNLIKKYLHAEDFFIKTRSLQALGYILIARPEYMLEKDVGKILVATLSSSTDMRLKMQSLQNIFEYLLDAESQMGTNTDSNDVDIHPVGGGSSVPVAAGAGDTNICGGIIQLYWNKILGRCLDVNEQVRQSAVKIVEVVLRQGLVHPITCVPSLIALETDPQESNSKLAHHLLMNMNEKYPAFFETRLGDGLQTSFAFIRSLAASSDPNVQSKVPDNMKGKSDNGAVTHARLGVSRIYKLIRGNRNSRNRFMFSVVRKFDTPAWSDVIVPFLMYCTEILSLLPFTVPDEPLYLIYSINRVIQVRAGSLEASIKSYLQSVQQNVNTLNGNGVTEHEMTSQRGSDQTTADLNGTLKEESADQVMLNHSASGNSDLHSKISCDPCGVTEDGLQKTQVHCLAATAIQLLLKLKRHLKIVYSLNDARCQEFSPNEPLKPGDALSKQNIPFNVSDTRTDKPTTYEEVLQRYQEFKVALREDTVDYSTYTANIKKRRPTPSKPTPAKPTPSKRGRPVRMAVRYEDDDDDDDDDDETWGSASRRPNNSARRSNGRGR